MEKYFQVFVDLDGENQTLPMRIREDQLLAFRKYTEKSCVIFTSFGKYRVNEDYDHLSARFFGFVNNGPEGSENEESQDLLQPKKRVLVRRRKTVVDDSFYDHNQPETNY